MADRWRTKALDLGATVDIPDPGWYGLCLWNDGDGNVPNGPLQLVIHQQSPGAEERPPLGISLPFVHDKQALVDESIGTLIFLEQNCRVHVEPPLEHWHYRLVCSTMTGHRHESHPMGSQPLTKQLVCATCAKNFATLVAARQHVQSRHDPRPPESMWNRPLEIVYNDDFVAVVVKPQGMAVMGSDNETLLRSDLLLPLKCPQQVLIADDGSSDAALPKPRPVHRLDAATGGLLVLAKTRNSYSSLQQAFELRQCHKTYRALVLGNVQGEEGCLDAPLSGQAANTHYRVLRRIRSRYLQWLTEVALEPVTGRKHQLRRHLQLMGHSILGDKRYGGRPLVLQSADSQQPYSRLCLWAMEIRFPHPASGQEIDCRMNEPEWLQYVINHEEPAYQQSLNDNELL